MKACDLCLDLDGKPSSVPPHAGLAASGVGAFGVPGRNMQKVQDNWHCTDCGTWMFQGTEQGTPPNVWRAGERPADWPEGGEA